VQGDKTSHDYDIKLIAGPMLLSKVIIFNLSTRGVQVNDILDKLALLTKVAEKYCPVTTGEKPFGFLHIVFRSSTKGEMQAGVAHRKAQLLRQEPGAAASTRNAIRKRLVDSFEGIECHLLPDCVPWPDPLRFEDLELPGQVGYHDYVQELRRDVAKQLVEPRTVPASGGGHEVLSGPKLAEKMEQIAKSITEDRVFVMSALDAMDENERLKAANEELKKAQEELAIEQEKLQEEMQRVAEEKESVEKDQEMLGDTLPLARALKELLKMDKEKAKQLAGKLAATPEQMSRVLSGDDEEAAAVICELFEHAEHAAQAHIRLALESRIITELTETVNIKESLATQLVAAMALGIDSPRAVVDCLREPSRILSLLTQWAKSAACGDRALDVISLALRSVLAEKADQIESEKIKKLVLTAVGSLEITRPQVLRLIRGEIDELLKDVVGTVATKYLDHLAPGLQHKAERAAEIAARVEEVAAKVDSATSGMVSGMVESLLQAGEQLPGLGLVFGLMGGVYKAAKGAVRNKPACTKFGHFVQRKERLLRRAMGAPNIQESIAEVQRVLREATAFLETMQESKGFFRRMLTSASDAGKLKELATELDTAMKDLQMDLAVEGVLAMHERDGRVAAKAIGVSEQQEAAELEVLRKRVKEKVGCNADGELQLEELRSEDIAPLVADLPFDAQELQTELTAHLAEIKADTEKMLVGQEEIKARQEEAAAVEQQHHDEILGMLESMKTGMAPVATPQDIERAVAEQLQNKEFVARLELLPEEQRKQLRQQAQQDFMEEAIKQSVQHRAQIVKEQARADSGVASSDVISAGLTSVDTELVGWTPEQKALLHAQEELQQAQLAQEFNEQKQHAEEEAASIAEQKKAAEEQAAADAAAAAAEVARIADEKRAAEENAATDAKAKAASIAMQKAAEEQAAAAAEVARIADEKRATEENAATEDQWLADTTALFGGKDDEKQLEEAGAQLSWRIADEKSLSPQPLVAPPVAVEEQSAAADGYELVPRQKTKIAALGAISAAPRTRRDAAARIIQGRARQRMEKVAQAQDLRRASATPSPTPTSDVRQGLLLRGAQIEAATRQSMEKVAQAQDLRRTIATRSPTPTSDVRQGLLQGLTSMGVPGPPSPVQDAPKRDARAMRKVRRIDAEVARSTDETREDAAARKIQGRARQRMEKVAQAQDLRRASATPSPTPTSDVRQGLLLTSMGAPGPPSPVQDAPKRDARAMTKVLRKW
jgi:hypothetical protein